MSAAPMSDWDPVMLEVYLTDVEEPVPNEDLLLELRRSVLSQEFLGIELPRSPRRRTP